jgi:uncharacterized membrane protein (DUF4010 family)
MMARVVAIAGALEPRLILTLGPAVAAGAATLAIGAAMLLRGRGKATLGGATPALVLRNPFDLGTVLKLAALIAVIVVAAKALSAYVGARGLYLLAAASGIADVDALTLSVARLAGGQIGIADATGAILLAVGVNTAAKAAMAAHLGGRSIGAPVGVGSALAIVALTAAHAFIRL